MVDEGVLRFITERGTKVTLRPAGCPDAEQIVSVIGTHARDRSYGLMEHYGTRPDSVKQYICDMDFDRNLLLVAIVGRDVVGVLSAIQMDGGKRPQTAHILNVGLHIAPACRGEGIGSKMIEYAAEWAKGRGFKKLEAMIFMTNKKSLHLFERAGFIEEGTRQKRIRIGKQYIDEVLMGKIL